MDFHQVVIGPSPRQTWWRHQMETFSALLAICAGNSQVPFDVSLICVWINWVNNREAGDLRRYCTHYDVTVMIILGVGVSNWSITFEKCWNETLFFTSLISTENLKKILYLEKTLWLFLYQNVGFSENILNAADISLRYQAEIISCSWLEYSCCYANKDSCLC